MVRDAVGPGQLLRPCCAAPVLSAARACWGGNCAAGIAMELLRGAWGRWAGRHRPKPCGGRPRRCPAPLRCVNAGDSGPAAEPDRYCVAAVDPSQKECFRVSSAPWPLIGGTGGACARGVSGRYWELRRRVVMAEVEETLKRIQSHKGVQGLIVANSDGIPIRSTMDNTTTIQYVGLMHSFIMKARSAVRNIDPQNDLTFLRIRTKKNEIMVAPDPNCSSVLSL
ncbi:uncharacterized protein LOC128081185 isoform X2 [Tympanuchus pallidicinctus]|uniref:uncharacterized protein LOC128081185 isoform X2 n=1 Tax=Tympanuchus pallidicinctus TaxID=109042 RepID=UPI002286EBED|nr:uncharacterized protein LOC128081185 isoform X2 [Tympanuchus pallidicinctus]